MTEKSYFPERLLESSIKERIDYFRNFTVAHPLLIKVADRLVAALTDPDESTVIFLFGPSGVGKTTLLLRTIEKLIDQFMKEYEENKGRVLFAGFEAPTPDLRNFSWKDFYIRALKALDDPLVDIEDHLVARTYLHSSTKAALRLLLERNLKYRQPKLFYIDEAQNLGRVSTSKHLKDQSECIKSISNLGQVPILLVGTYELLPLQALSGQLCRRSTEIHYPRYRLDSASDVKAFKNVLYKFQRHLPLEEEPDLMGHWDFCYERSLGCIGILKTWLLKALKETLRGNKDTSTIQLTDLEKHAFSLNACSTMFREICQGEKALQDTITRDYFRIELGLEPIISIEPDVNSNKSPVAQPSQPRRVGEPNPERRKVGDDKNAS
ncbi:ATP-binding protein [Nodosilinea nodulosa]|uniref:ATP-binding protein n=1 Tax=Nodosilinea nodulosa TaxID=416001 RepID=UPI000316D46A|nr:ATP-binding protein [Nodosilinea nodulosa]